MYKIAVPSKTKEILTKYNIRLSKYWGQNFLIDYNIVQMIVEAACEPGDFVIEIGPGIGSLTQALLSKAAEVAAVEIDAKLVEILKSEFEDKNKLTVVEGDILKQNVDELAASCFAGNEKFIGYNVLGNLPYYCTTPILFHLFGKGKYMKMATLMMQKEVAERVVASAGEKEYGSLSVACQYYSKPEVVLRVSRNNFFPKPEVDSAVVRFNMYSTPPIDVCSEDLFFAVVRAAFNQRRKTILNSLSNLLPDVTKKSIKTVLERAEIDCSVRGEVLSIEDFAAVSNELCLERKEDKEK